MTLRLSGHFSLFGLVFFVFKSPLGIVRQRSHEKFLILTQKPHSRVRILIYQTWAVSTVPTCIETGVLGPAFDKTQVSTSVQFNKDSTGTKRKCKLKHNINQTDIHEK